MSGQSRHSVLYWFLLIGAVLMVGWTVVTTLDLLLHPIALNPPPLFRLFVGLVATPATIVAGFLIIRRAPGNVVGVLIVIYGAAFSAGTLRTEVDVPLVVGINYTMSATTWPALLLLPSYFPTGVPYPQRITLVLNALAIVLFVIVWLGLFGPTVTHFSYFGAAAPVYSNPLSQPTLTALSAALDPISFPLVLLLILTGLVSGVLRYRAATQRERAQMRWLLWGFLGFVVLTLIGNATSNFANDLFNSVFYSYLALFPAVTVGNAILRHRLYDIDIIIRRTLIYFVLTALLAGVYFGGVVLLQTLLRPLTGAGNDLAVVATTLGIAALFLPLRRRVQGFIDRRFYRRKYDAAQTLAAFSATVRDETDLDRLTGRLVAVVDETMQPGSIGLWIAPIRPVGKEHP